MQSPSRAQFFAIAANLMRQILVNHAKHHRAAKRGGGNKVALEEGAAVVQPRGVDLIALDDGLGQAGTARPAAKPDRGAAILWRIDRRRDRGGAGRLRHHGQARLAYRQGRTASPTRGRRSGAGGAAVTPERWQQVKEVLEAAWERDAAERGGFLDQACADDPELRSDVEALLASDETPREFLAAPAMDLAEIGEATLAGGVEQVPEKYSQLGAYRILGRIGSGGMGEVYRVADVNLGREVALKVLPAGTARILTNWNVSAVKLAPLPPSITRILSLSIPWSRPRAFTSSLWSWSRARHLQELVVAEGLPVERIIEIALPLADALAAAHDKGLIHRDLKPANIMITHNGRVKVLDFGVAQIFETAGPSAPGSSFGDTRTGMVIGTPAYMSPEQISGRELDQRTDIFSLGIILYELATGHRPFHGVTTMELAASILRDAPQPISGASSGFPVEFTEVIWQCLEKDPAKRIQTARLLASALQQMRLQERSYGSRPASSTPVVADEGFWIAVLPFRHSGEDPSIEALAEGLAEGIITGLSRFSYLRVIAQASTLKYASHASDLRANAKELGARYVMEGSIRKAGSNCRLAVQLSDVTTATHLWAETFDRPFRSDDIFALQDQLIPRIVSTVADQNGVLPRSMSNILAQRGSGPFSPYEASLRAFRYFVNLKPQEHAEVRDILEAAVAVAPQHSDCQALLSVVSWSEYANGFNPRPDPLGRAIRAARLAVESGPTNHLAHTALAYTLFMQKDLRAFRPAAERSLELNRMDGTTAGFLGMLIAYSGDWDHGCAVLERAMQLNPNHPRWYYCGLFYNAYRKRDYAAALEIAFRIDMPGNFYSFMTQGLRLRAVGTKRIRAQSDRQHVGHPPRPRLRSGTPRRAEQMVTV